MKSKLSQKRVLIAIGLGTVLFGITAYPAVTSLIAVGSIPHSDLVDGPATVTVRQLTVAPGEVLAWHYHLGYVMTVVKQGTLTLEDGCGGEEVFMEGQAFEETPGRVHRGKNLGDGGGPNDSDVHSPTGTPLSVSVPNDEALCGPPASVGDCQNGGWMNFSQPRRFTNQGDCEQYVNTGK